MFNNFKMLKDEEYYNNYRKINKYKFKIWLKIF